MEKLQSGATTALRWIRKNLVLCIAITASIVTSCIVLPDETYLSYFDWKTLTCLFCVLAVVCALKNIQFFYILAKKIVQLFRNARLAILALVYITFLGSMLIANDMALLTFLPLGYFVLTTTHGKIHGIHLHHAEHCRQFRRNAHAFRESAKSIFVLQVSYSQLGIHGHYAAAILGSGSAHHSMLFDFCSEGTAFFRGRTGYFIPMENRCLFTAVRTVHCHRISRDSLLDRPNYYSDCIAVP